MTFNQIQYVLKIAEEGSINKAASSLFVSQSLLSTALKNLENELGQQIFLRTHRGVTLTRFGETFVAYIQPIARQIDRLDDFLVFGRSRSQKQLTFTNNGFSFIGRICADIYQNHQADDLQISCLEDFGTDALLTVANGEASVGIVRLWDCYADLDRRQLDSLDLEFHPAVTLDVGLTVGPSNPYFFREESWVSPEMLSRFPSVVYERLDKSAYGDVYERLGIKSYRGKIIAHSRAFLYDIIAYTDAFYLNSDYTRCNYARRFENAYTIPQRTLRIRDCRVHSIIGWIKRRENALTQLEEELIEKVTDALAVAP